MNASQRLQSLDVLRGLTIAGMILANNPGTWSYVYPPLRHAAWNGLTPTDCIFPLFLFMMGMSMYLSLRKFDFEYSRSALLKILRRTFLIFIIGTGIYTFENIMSDFRYVMPHPATASDYLNSLLHSLTHVRTLGVLQRLALCYGIGSVIVLCVRHKYLPRIIAALLLTTALLYHFGNAFDGGTQSIVSKIDIALLGAQHMINDNGIDPEGILGTLPAVAHVLIGFLFGKLCSLPISTAEKVSRLLLYGTILLLAVLLLQYLCPINKKLWSPTFVLATCGFGAQLLALLMWSIDLRGRTSGTWAAKAFGTNPLFCYVLSEVVYLFIAHFPLTGTPLRTAAYNVLASAFGDNAFTSMLYALLFTAAIWAAGAWLYRRRIFIKI